MEPEGPFPSSEEAVTAPPFPSRIHADSAPTIYFASRVSLRTSRGPFPSRYASKMNTMHVLQQLWRPDRVTLSHAAKCKLVLVRCIFDKHKSKTNSLHTL